LFSAAFREFVADEGHARIFQIGSIHSSGHSPGALESALSAPGIRAYVDIGASPARLA